MVSSRDAVRPHTVAAPTGRIVGVTALAKLSARLVSVSTDGTHLSARALTATTTAHGTHTGKGHTRGIVGVASSRPKTAPSSTTA